MTEVRLKPHQIAKLAFPSRFKQTRGKRTALDRHLPPSAIKLLRWASANMVILAEDCPECGAIEELGQQHGRDCEHRP